MAASESSDSEGEAFDVQNEDGWEDLEPDVESQSFQSLFEDKIFGDITQMLQHDRDKHSFDFVEVKQKLKLDYIDQIRLINFVRWQVREGNKMPSNWSTSLFSDEKYLKPALDDDAVLFSLEDIDESRFGNVAPENELERKSRDQRDRIDQLEQQFSAYREKTFESFRKRVELEETAAETGSSADQPNEKDSQDRSYFTSYSTSSIHASMLKDTIRTSAYRDFIYDNKQLFAGKTVLDIGCGTGILSMFCAKAGAKLVIAVDASDIIDKARAIIYENGLQDKIRCLKGKIEEIELPSEAKQVDVIVSEWMGYGLLYESMLDSVLWARDRYLEPINGMMVPSHATIHMAPLIDSQIRDDQIGFWNDVYGFDMRAMIDKDFYSEAVVAPISAGDVSGPSTAIVELDLCEANVADLSFKHPFRVSWPNSEDQTLDGWAIWFDVSFSGRNSLKTGPHGPQTHWQQVSLLAKKQESGGKAARISGTIEYRKLQVRERSLEIEMEWEVKQGDDANDKMNGNLEDQKIKEKEKGRHHQLWLLD